MIYFSPYTAQPIQKRNTTEKGIISMVADHYGLNTELIYEPTRRMEIAEPRQIAMTLLRQYTYLSLTAIGKLFSRDHATVIHAIKQTAGHFLTDKHMRDDLLPLVELLDVKYPRYNNIINIKTKIQ